MATHTSQANGFIFIFSSAFLCQPTSGDTSHGANFWKKASKNYFRSLQTSPRSFIYASFGGMGTSIVKQTREIEGEGEGL
ncbi:hypothetical protein AAZX31_04G163200 [Glycine max]|uniref:Secreted protein n=1 Tax=Glycine max TaxID=3847 RepID=A0A0R0KGN8_SOYBN|nr:hypothetical protein JHK85_010912 [Glycine max]KAH1111896.1 hypothetical protein GYH30_010311 [Glycine max]KRH63475.1 hypothetical protein GLYMA_04G179600v4 [Glycine max]